VYDLHPTQDSFHKNALLSIVPKIGIQQQGIIPFSIVLIESEGEEFCLGTAIAININTNSSLWCVLMGTAHAHCVPLSRLPIAGVTAWMPNEA